MVQLVEQVSFQSFSEHYRQKLNSLVVDGSKWLGRQLQSSSYPVQFDSVLVWADRRCHLPAIADIIRQRCVS